MAEKNKVGAVSFFNSRLTSIISISLVLFLLGLIFLMGLLGNKLSVYVKEYFVLHYFKRQPKRGGYQENAKNT